MAALGNTPIQLYYSNTAGNSPSSVNLISGELAINMADGVLYYKNASNIVSILATNAAVSIANTDYTTITLGNPGTYGGVTNVASITVAANGRITSVSNVAISAGGGGSSSGYLANSVIFANSTGYLANTSNISFFASNNTLQVTGNVIVTGTIGGISPRTFNVATIATATPNASNTDLYIISALNQTPNVTFAAPTGTTNDGQKLMIRIKDAGTANAITWTTTSGGYRAVGITLPTTTVAGKVLYVGCIYNSQDTYWDVIATGQL